MFPGSISNVQSISYSYPKVVLCQHSDIWMEGMHIWIFPKAKVINMEKYKFEIYQVRREARWISYWYSSFLCAQNFLCNGVFKYDPPHPKVMPSREDCISYFPSFWMFELELNLCCFGVIKMEAKNCGGRSCKSNYISHYHRALNTTRLLSSDLTDCESIWSSLLHWVKKCISMMFAMLSVQR